MASILTDLQMGDLRAVLSGELIELGGRDYDDARAVAFTGFDRHPLAIARAANAEDVARVVSFARDEGLELAVRGGGHSRAGHGTSEGGIVIDLSGMKKFEIDSDARTVWVETGMTAGEYTDTMSEHGLATGLGDTGSVGIGGITLAGGIGFLVRKYGVTVDDVLAADVVTADGEVVRASESSEPDLFWAIRGGGGNFGIVTRLQLRLHEVSHILGGMLILPATPAVIAGCVEAAEAAPEELSMIADVTLAPPLPFIPEDAHGAPILIGRVAYVGPLERGEAVLAPFRGLAKPYVDMVRVMRYRELYDGPEQAVRFAAGANFFAASLPVDGPEAILDGLPRSTAMMKAVQLRVLGGAVARVPAGATAFAHRHCGLFVNIAAMYADGAEKSTHDSWVNGIADDLGMAGAGGYVGFLGDEDESTIRAAYPGGTWDRLRGLKRRYDSHNLFRLNHNIPPSEH